MKKLSALVVALALAAPSTSVAQQNFLHANHHVKTPIDIDNDGRIDQMQLEGYDFRARRLFLAVDAHNDGFYETIHSGGLDRHGHYCSVHVVDSNNNRRYDRVYVFCDNHPTRTIMINENP